MFRQCTAALMLLAVCLCGYAQASTDVTNPSMVNAPVQYPASAVAAREQGTASVKVLVDTNGHTAGATIDKSSGHEDLDAAALQSISQWSFSPGTKNGKPEARWVVVPVTFQLTEASSGEVPTGRYALALSGTLLGMLGVTIWLVGFVWSVVLAKRKSILWLSGMVALWLITYPLFVATHWSVAKRNLLVVVLGFALMGVSLYLPAFD